MPPPNDYWLSHFEAISADRLRHCFIDIADCRRLPLLAGWRQIDDD
jgi:hypothetical protein